jgi:hypothetical protein
MPEDVCLNRRQFLKAMGCIGAGALGFFLVAGRLKVIPKGGVT